MPHRRAHHGRHLIRLVVQAVDQLLNERRHQLHGRTGIDLLAGAVVADEDRARAPPSRVLGEVVAHHHEVERLEQIAGVGEVRISSLLKNIGHRQAVPFDRKPGLVLRIERLLASDRSDGIVHRDVIAFDAVRSLDRAREGAPPQETAPSSRRDREGELLLQRLDLLEHLPFQRIESRRFSHEGGDAGGAAAFQGKTARAPSSSRWTAPPPAWPRKRRASQTEKRSRATAARGVGVRRGSIDAKSYHNCATALRYPWSG